MLFFKAAYLLVLAVFVSLGYFLTILSDRSFVRTITIVPCRTAHRDPVRYALHTAAASFKPTSPLDRTAWLIDSGASDHITCNLKYFVDWKRLHTAGTHHPWKSIINPSHLHWHDRAEAPHWSCSQDPGCPLWPRHWLQSAVRRKAHIRSLQNNVPGRNLPDFRQNGCQHDLQTS